MTTEIIVPPQMVIQMKGKVMVLQTVKKEKAIIRAQPKIRARIKVQPKIRARIKVHLTVKAHQTVKIRQTIKMVVCQMATMDKEEMVDKLVLEARAAPDLTKMAVMPEWDLTVDNNIT